MLTELESGDTTWSEVSTTAPSPFAAEIVWKRTNRLMYEDDVPDEGPQTRLSRDLLRELVHGSHLRPPIPNRLIEDLEAKLQRLHPGYAPQTGDELIDWVLERVVIPESEWRRMLEAIARDTGRTDDQMNELLQEGGNRLVRLSLPEPAAEPVVAHIETLGRIARALGVA